jgi:hypothetical protein
VSGRDIPEARIFTQGGSSRFLSASFVAGDALEHGGRHLGVAEDLRLAKARLWWNRRHG